MGHSSINGIMFVAFMIGAMVGAIITLGVVML
ncbi:hypothetical protein ACVWZ4_000013 [Bradyrhizobium sp. USDA 4472]